MCFTDAKNRSREKLHNFWSMAQMCLVTTDAAEFRCLPIAALPRIPGRRRQDGGSFYWNNVPRHF